jgi:hypothetical protein
MAVQDAVAAATRLASPLCSGEVTDNDLQAIQERRVPPVRFTQWLQPTIQKRIISRVLESRQRPKPPLFFEVFSIFPVLRRILQEETAKAGEKFWSGLRDMHAEKVEGTKGLITTAERDIAARQAAIAEADVKTAAAKERLDRLARGESVASGFGKPMTLADVIKATGWTASDVRRALLTHAISEAGGFEMLMTEIGRSQERAEQSARRAVAARLGLSTKRR